MNFNLLVFALFCTVLINLAIQSMAADSFISRIQKLCTGSDDKNGPAVSRRNPGIYGRVLQMLIRREMGRPVRVRGRHRTQSSKKLRRKRKKRRRKVKSTTTQMPEMVDEWSNNDPNVYQ